eukprot:tig00000241_g20867.t1
MLGLFRIAPALRQASAARLCAPRLSVRHAIPHLERFSLAGVRHRGLATKRNAPPPPPRDDEDDDDDLDAMFDDKMQAKLKIRTRITAPEVIDLMARGKGAEARRRMDELSEEDAEELERELHSFRDRAMAGGTPITPFGKQLVASDSGALAQQEQGAVQHFDREEERLVPDEEEVDEEQLLVELGDEVRFGGELAEEEDEESTSESGGETSESTSSSDEDEDGLTPGERADFDAIEKALEAEWLAISQGRAAPKEDEDIDAFLAKVAPRRKGGLRPLDEDEDDEADDEWDDDDDGQVPDLTEEDVKNFFGDPHLVATRTTTVTPEDTVRGKRASYVQEMEPQRDDSRTPFAKHLAPGDEDGDAAPQAMRPLQNKRDHLEDIAAYEDDPQLYGRLHKLKEHERKRGQRWVRREELERRRRRRGKSTPRSRSPPRR